MATARHRYGQQTHLNGPGGPGSFYVLHIHGLTLLLFKFSLNYTNIEDIKLQFHKELIRFDRVGRSFVSK